MRLVSILMTAAVLQLAGTASAQAQTVVPAKTGAPLKVGEEIRDCENCPSLIVLPAGSFLMGTSLEEEVRHAMPVHNRGKALPLRTVTFASSFAMGKYPVTIAQFREFVNESGYKPADSCFTYSYPGGISIYESSRGYTWRSAGIPQEDNHPVVCVTSEDAQAYADWLSQKTGHAYAIPNEAQYEYATRAGTKTSFFWGDDRDARACEFSNQPDLAQARYHGNIPSGPDYRFQCSDGYAFTSPVGHYKPNPWGLYDMQGNIWEWTSDCWNDNYQGAPTDGSTWRTGDCDARSSRGGSWGNAVFSAMAGIRAPRAASFAGHSWGFRVVRNDIAATR